MTVLPLAIFDCDGTLVDSQHTIIRAMRDAFAAIGLPESEDAAVRRIVGLSLADAMRDLLPDADESTREAAVAAYKDAFFEIRRRGEAQEELYEGIAQLLEALSRAGVLLGVATGKSHAGLLKTLDHHGLRGHFVTLQTADRNPGKPDPAMVVNAVREAGADRAATLVIGDTSYDMMMAQNAGVPGLGVAWGYHPADELEAAGAHAVAKDVAGLERLIMERLAV